MAFDAMGHGESEGKTIHAKQYAECLVLINKEFGQLHGIVGHSFAGLAICLAVEEELKDIEKIVLIAPASETTRAIDNFFEFLKMPINLKPELIKHIFEQSGNSPEFYSVPRALDNITSKVLWVHDKKDFICPIEDTIATQEKNKPNIEFYITSGLGHNAIYRNPNVLQKIAFFLYE